MNRLILIKNMILSDDVAFFMWICEFELYLKASNLDNRYEQAKELRKREKTENCLNKDVKNIIQIVRVIQFKLKDCFDRKSCESSNGSSQKKHNEHGMCIENDKSNHHKILILN